MKSVHTKVTYGIIHCTRHTHTVDTSAQYSTAHNMQYRTQSTPLT
jgi:hypothetical protein